MVSDAIADGVETVIDYVSGRDDIVYAEVNGIERQYTNAVVTSAEIRHTSELDTSGICFRLFVNGAADYRHTTVLDPDGLEDLVDRSVRAARNLAQDVPAAVRKTANVIEVNVNMSEKQDTIAGE